MRKTVLAIAVVSVFGTSGHAAAEPDLDAVLEIDGEVITTKVDAPADHPLNPIISGWHYRTPETRALQMDDFQNPGMLYVERGAEIWETVEGSEGKSCASCHGDAAESMRGVGATMPKWNAALNRPVNIELQINHCRTERMGAAPYKFDAPDQKALTTFIRHQSRGMPVSIDLSQGDMQSWWEKGKEIYYTRYGQLNFACATCHENYNGRYLRADHLSQGHINGFPTYRLKQADMVSLHSRFKGCMRDARAVPFEPLGDEFLALEVYVATRGAGLAVETPAVRQ